MRASSCCSPENVGEQGFPILLEKLRNAVFFQWFVCRVSPKVGLLKRRVRSHVVKAEIKNCTLLWWQKPFSISYVAKLHGTVAQSAFSSQNVQNTSGSDHFLNIAKYQSGVCAMDNDSGTMEQWTMTMEQWNSDQWNNGQWKSVCGGGNSGEKWNAFRVVSYY